MDIANGAISDSHVSYGSEVTYNGSDGFELTGPSSRTCQADGTLSGSEPFCDGKNNQKYVRQIHVLDFPLSLIFHT